MEWKKKGKVRYGERFTKKGVITLGGGGTDLPPPKTADYSLHDKV